MMASKFSPNWKPLGLVISTSWPTNHRKGTTIEYLYSNVQNGVCADCWFCLFVCLSTLIVNDEFVKILQATPPPSSTCSAELACIAVVIQLLLQEAGPNYSSQTLWNKNDSIYLTLACEDSWGRSQPGPSNTHQFTMHSFGDALNQWRLHWCASGLWRYTA